MSTPPPPGQPPYSPQQPDEHFGQQTSQQQPYGQHSPGQQPYGQQPFGQTDYWPPVGQPQKRRNVVGAIALGTAILGFIFGCIPGALIIGWVLLPIAFILGIVGLFMSQRPKGTAIAAVIVSIIGTIVSAVVFVTLVGDAVDDAFSGGGDVTVSEEGPGDAPAPANPEAADSDADAGSRQNPARIGATITSGDWEVVVNSFNPNATQQVLEANPFNSEPTPGNQYAVVNLTVTYRGEESADAGEVGIAFVTDHGNVFTTYDNAAVPPAPALEGELYTGAAATGNEAILIPQNSSGLMRLRLGMLGDEVFVSVR